ncbi:hypothetical protein C3L33_20052, partial [Rhododendron williamsianum]
MREKERVVGRIADVKMEEREEDGGSDKRRKGDDQLVEDREEGVKKEVNSGTPSMRGKDRGENGNTGIGRSTRARVTVNVLGYGNEEDEGSGKKGKRGRRKSNGMARVSKKKGGNDGEAKKKGRDEKEDGNPDPAKGSGMTSRFGRKVSRASMEEKEDTKRRRAGSKTDEQVQNVLLSFMLLYPKMTEEDFANACPVCQYKCNCKSCLRLEVPFKFLKKSDLVLEDEEKIQHARYILQALLPFLKDFHREQLREKEIEAKIQGIS